MDDFASTALFNLIAIELRKQGLNVSLDPGFDGKTSGSAKRDLLDIAMDELGPAGVLQIGQGIRHIDFHPILAVLRKSRDPNDLLQRWQRLEGYYHGRHRVRQLAGNTQSLTLCHYSTDNTAPTAGEDLVIAGFLCALLQSIGVTGLLLTIDNTVAVNNGVVLADCTGVVVTSHWDFSWSGHSQALAESTPLATETDVVSRVKELIVSDPARGWNLQLMAAELQTSTRTLQRRLSAAGSSFQLLLREARVECAARGLLQVDASLGETGYTCGFSDQAHFSREFKKRYNFSPSEYADLVRAGSLDTSR